jgi:hypothetical protein
LQSCADARVEKGMLTAKCQRADHTFAVTSMSVPCSGGTIDNLDGVLICAGGVTPAELRPTR